MFQSEFQEFFLDAQSFLNDNPKAKSQNKVQAKQGQIQKAKGKFGLCWEKMSRK